jgi:hypothetical protein
MLEADNDQNALLDTLQHVKGSRKNNFTFSHPVFKSSLAAPQSQNPRNSATIPVVLLNRRNQI